MRLKELRKAKGLTLQKIAQWRQPLSDWVIRFIIRNYPFILTQERNEKHE